MPRKPRKTKSRVILTNFEQVHLMVGQVFNDNRISPNHFDKFNLSPDAASIWQRNRSRLLALWNDPSPCSPAQKSNFGPSGCQGAGRLGMPTWAEIVFENAVLPKLDRSWPEDVKFNHKRIKNNLPPKGRK